MFADKQLVFTAAMIEKERKKVKILKIAVCVLAVLCLALLIALIVVVSRDKREIKVEKSDSHEAAGFCPEALQFQVTAQPKSSGLFDDLSEQEIIAVRDYMLRQPSLNLTPYEDAAINTNYIYLIELKQPSKDKALQFLDQNGTKPARQARVVIYKGGVAEPRVQEYLVSPAQKPDRHVTSKGPGHKPISFHSRVPDSIEEDVWDVIVLNVTKHAFRLLNESYDGWTLYNCTDRCLTWSYSGPPLKSGDRKFWLWLVRYLPGFSIHPVGFEILINSEGSDVSRWGVAKLFYHNATFDTVDELMEAYDGGTIYKAFIPTPKDPLFSSFLRRGAPQPQKPLRGPRQFEPDGKRYAVSGHHVEYMGWSFDFRVRTTSGLQLFDIRFKGERLVYELSGQEATAFYSGWSPMQMMTNYMDTAWGMGSSFELIRGMDCPEAATFFDVVHYKSTGQPMKFKNAVCVFEMDTGLPLRRHFNDDFEGGYTFAGGLTTNVLVLRTIATPYNYDYIFDYVFYASGVLQARVSTTGYVQATYWTPNEAPYGNLIHSLNVAGTIHDHFIHYKVDLDIAGRKNSYETLDVELENITNRWFPGYRHIQKVVRPRQKSTEKAALYRYNFDHPKYLNFYSETDRNKMGVKRGYRVQINSAMKQMYPEDWPLTNGTSWMFNQMAVTKHKDTEERSSSMYIQNDPYDPAVDFRKFYEDDENIENKDLVAWVTLGLMHIPHSEDIPNTGTAANSVNFFLRPYNYFDEDPSMASSDAVLITPTDSKFSGSKVNRFGTPTGPVCAPRDHPNEYKGAYGHL